jgi:hypothetical protein
LCPVYLNTFIQIICIKVGPTHCQHLGSIEQRKLQLHGREGTNLLTGHECKVSMNAKNLLNGHQPDDGHYKLSHPLGIRGGWHAPLCEVKSHKVGIGLGPPWWCEVQAIVDLGLAPNWPYGIGLRACFGMSLGVFFGATWSCPRAALGVALQNPFGGNLELSWDNAQYCLAFSFRTTWGCREDSSLLSWDIT